MTDINNLVGSVADEEIIVGEVSTADELVGDASTEESVSGDISVGNKYQGESAYEVAVRNGFDGSEEEWLQSLQGADGEPGRDGVDGYTPIKGVDYFDGKNGIDGKDGVDGKPGEPGPQGPAGKDGYTPIKGVDYFDGKPGEPGPQGLKGDKGDSGQNGKDGKDGAQGPKGDTGEPGPQGPAGADGRNGKDGVDGKNGKDGVSVTHTWEGTTLTVTSASGTSSANLKGDKGDPGEPGPQGPPGKDGSGGGAQADWNAAEGEPGHILNRPFYSYMDTTVSRSKLASGTYTSEYMPDFGAFVAAVGIDTSAWFPGCWTFDIVFDGVEYKELEAFNNELAGMLVGNGAILAPLFLSFGLPVPEDTGEPFVIKFVDDDPIATVLLVSDLTKSTTNDFSFIHVEALTEEKHVKLSEKYYNAGVGKNYIFYDSCGEIFNDYSRNTASGQYSHAEGYSTEAGGFYSHAEGGSTKAYGRCSHAEGFSTEARGIYSHAEGYSTKAIGQYSHAEGYSTEASGQYSHAEGYSTEAGGFYSHAEGYSTKANGECQHVQGVYNIEDNNKYAHIVGNGEDVNHRSNAHTLDWYGNAWFQGTIKVGGTGQDDALSVNVLTEADMSKITAAVIAALPIYNGEVITE